MKSKPTQLLFTGLILLLSAVTTVSQTATSSLSNLPEAEALIYINPQRLINEALPKVMPEKDLANMREGFSMMKQHAGVDPTKIEYIVIASRFQRPTADLNVQLGEFMIVAGGDFSAESLIVLGRMASGGKLVDEKYGTKTLSLMTIDEVAKMAQTMPLLKSFSQVGIVALNTNTIAVGSPGYLRAAIDAGEGKSRIAAESLNSLMRDPNVLISIAGAPWSAFAKSFGMMGTDASPHPPRCDSRLGNFYAALTMDAVNFKLRGAMNADNPTTAQIMNNLLSGLLKHGMSAIPDKSAQDMLKGLSLMAQGDEVVLQADFPQQMVVEMIRKQMIPPKKDEPAAPAAKPPVKRPVRKPARRRG